MTKPAPGQHPPIQDASRAVASVAPPAAGMDV
jgi:hypothetical protein